MALGQTIMNKLNPIKMQSWWIMSIPSDIAGYAWQKLGNLIRGDKKSTPITSTTSVQTPKKLETYNSRYPWFDEADYLRLEQLVDQQWVTWSKKAQLMDEAYQYYYPQVLNHHKLDERQETINNWVYENGEKLANGDKQTNIIYRAMSLAQMGKQAFDIAYNVNDSDVIKAIKNEVPNWEELLKNFLNTWDPELLYKAWIYNEWEAPEFRSQKDIANEVLWGNRWKQAWSNMKANSFAPLDSWEKSIYKWYKNVGILQNKLDQYLADVVPEWDYKDKILDGRTVEEFKAEKQWNIDRAKQEIDDYIWMVNYANQKNRENTVNPIVANYYNRRDFTDLLAEWDIDGFFYKWLWDAASNRDMPIIIWASVVNPAMWTALMGTNSYVRESQDAYETMRNAGATHEQAEAWWAVVWLINSAIEVWLDRALWWVETSSSKSLRESLKKNVMNQVWTKSFEDIIWSASKKYASSSLEEWLEEFLQNMVSNAAEMTVKENPEWKDLFKWSRSAVEWWIFNPMNLIAWGTDIYQNSPDAKTLVTSNANWTETVNNTTVEKQTNNWVQETTLKEKIYEIDPTLKKNLQDNPYAAEVWQRTKDYIDKNGRPERSNDVAKVLIEDVADRVQEKLMEKMEEWGETGKLYKPLLDAWYSVDLSELKDGIDEMLEDYWIKIEQYEWKDWKIKKSLDFSKTAIDGSEASNIQKIYNWIQDTNAPMSLKEYKDRFRRTLSDMVDFNPVGRNQAWRKTADTQWDIVLKSIRNKANDLAHNQIPALADLDKVFNEWVKVMDEVSDGLVYKDKSKKWVIRDNITQIIKNLDEPSRRQLANRLEQLIPWIREEVNAINQMPKVINHVYNPTWLQKIINSEWVKAAWAWVWALFWGLGAIPWYFAAKWLTTKIDTELDGQKSEAWDKAISETSEEWKARMQEIQNRIENNKKITEAQKQFLKKISEKLKEWKATKEWEVARIISEIASADEKNSLDVLDKAIKDLEILWAKEDVKDVKKIKAEVEKAMNEESEMSKAQKEFENEKKQILNESADQKLPEFKKRIYKLEQQEQRVWKVGKNKIWKTFEWKDYKKKQDISWLKAKDKLIEELWEYYNVDQFEAMDIYDRIYKTINPDDLK